MSKPKVNLVGRTLTVISQSPNRLILEEDQMGKPGDTVIVIDAKDIPDAHGDFALLEVREA